MSGDERWPDDGVSVAGTFVVLALAGLAGALERATQAHRKESEFPPTVRNPDDGDPDADRR